MSATLLKRLLDNRDAAEAKRNAISAALEQRMADAKEGDPAPTLTEAEEAEYRSAVEAIRAADSRIPELREAIAADQAAAEARRQLGVMAQHVRIKSEPMEYDRGTEHSWFRDVARALDPGQRDEVAAGRLRRYREQVDHVLAAAGAEKRANMNTTDGTGGEFVPPLWLVNQYVPIARAGRVTAELCRMVPLPAGTDSINMPTVASGSTVAAQTQGSAASNTDMTTSSVSATVRTAAGQQVIAMQLLDQSPINFDEVIFQDLMSYHAAYIDSQVLNGAGSPSITGILGTASINSTTYTDASPTVAECYPKLADAIQKIHTNRYLPPQAWVMHPVRWAWFLAALDSTNRPLVVPNVQGPQNAFAGFENVRSEGAVGALMGLPVYTDANVPTTLGGGTEDAIIAARFDDLYLYEGALRTRVLFETDANTLQVRFQLWNYFAFLASRYPKSIAKITGTGLAAPSF